MLNKLKAKLRAMRDGVPASFSELWVAGALYCREKDTKVPGFKLLFVNRDNGRDGAVVPLLKNADFTFHYTVIRGYRALGDDHIISPWSFDFQYSHATPHPHYLAGGE